MSPQLYLLTPIWQDSPPQHLYIKTLQWQAQVHHTVNHQPYNNYSFPYPLFFHGCHIFNTSTIRDASSSYGVYSRTIKNLLTKFEAHQHIRISKEQKPLVETINQIQITRWDLDRLDVKHGNKLYTQWELMIACVDRVLMNESYEEMKANYGIPRSTMTSHLRKICLTLQCRNTRQL